MSQGLRVLIVDDERISRETTVQQLREAGYTAEAVENAHQALDWLGESSWDVVVTDLLMPRMNGLQLLREVKRRFQGVPLIIMAAYASEETVNICKQEGAAVFLNKPFGFQELDSHLTKLGNRYKANRA